MSRSVASGASCSCGERGWRRRLASWRGISGSCLRAMCMGGPGSSGQMTVEFAIAFPVLLMVGFISVNAFIFLGDCTAFDIVARDAIRLQADDGPHEAQGCAETCARIEKGLSMEHETVSVTSERTAAGHIRYVARTAFSPPFLKGVRVFGIAVPPLEHEVTFVVSPYRAGVVA